jgi:hypothetical protein
VFFIPDGEAAFFSCKVDEKDTLYCHISIKHDADDKEDDFEVDSASNKLPTRPKLDVEFEDGEFRLGFVNFNSSAGTSLSKPLVFAESDDGRDITLMARIYKLKKMTQLNLQVMLENIA